MMKLIKLKNGKTICRFDVKGTVDLDYKFLNYAIKDWKYWKDPKTKSKAVLRKMFEKWVESYVLNNGISMLENTCIGLEDEAYEELRHQKIKKAKATIRKLAG